MDILSKREVTILKEALKFIIDKRRDYGHEREKLLSKIDGMEKVDLLPTMELQRILTLREGCESLTVPPHVDRAVDVRGPCVLTINRD